MVRDLWRSAVRIVWTPFDAERIAARSAGQRQLRNDAHGEHAAQHPYALKQIGIERGDALVFPIRLLGKRNASRDQFFRAESRIDAEQAGVAFDKKGRPQHPDPPSLDPPEVQPTAGFSLARPPPVPPGRPAPAAAWRRTP